jgi:hypothetical protein
MVINPLAPGKVVFAEYRDEEHPVYRGNPYIEALPAILSRQEAAEKMAYLPPYDPADRLLPSEIREDRASTVSFVRFPIAMHKELQARLSRLIRGGYAARNPRNPAFQAELRARRGALSVEGRGANVVVSTAGSVGPSPTATGMTLLGVTGIGKTAAIEMCLSLYPELIIHNEYKGRALTQTQVVRLYLQCPSDGSILTLCNNFFLALDKVHASLPTPTRYHAEFMHGRPAIQRLIPAMANLAAQHGLGVLVLDEVQDLNPRGSRAILSFLVQLVNTIGVPVVLLGGIDALPVLQSQFRQARRGASEGDMILDRAKPGQQWRSLCEAVWRYQYTREETPLTDKLLDVLYEECQGITHYMVLGYKLAQCWAISSGRERITPGVIRGVFKDCMLQARPVLLELRDQHIEENREALKRRGDVVVPDGYKSVPFARPDRTAPPKAAVVNRLPVETERAIDADDCRDEREREPVPEEASDWDAHATIAAPAPERPVIELPPGPTLEQIVRAGAARGVDEHASITAAGLAGDDLWDMLAAPHTAETAQAGPQGVSR